MTTQEAGRKGGNANTPEQQRARVENGKKWKGKKRGPRNKEKKNEGDSV